MAVSVGGKFPTFLVAATADRDQHAEGPCKACSCQNMRLNNPLHCLWFRCPPLPKEPTSQKCKGLAPVAHMRIWPTTSSRGRLIA